MLLIKNGTVITPSGSCSRRLWADGGKIIPEPSNPVNVSEYDASGCLVFPGFIDAHTHFETRTGETETADSFKTGTTAALAGGTTTVLDFATQEKGETLRAALEARLEKACGSCSCDYGFHMAVTDWNAKTKADIRKTADMGISSFKAYMAYDALRISPVDLRELFYECRDIGYVGVHCELGDEVNANIKKLLSTGKTGPRYHPVSRPNEVESLAVRECLIAARETGAKVWIVHLSTAESLEEIKKAREAGSKALVETCPQYLTLTDELYDLQGFEGAKYVCSPPLRGKKDVFALKGALQSGDVDIVSTDHCSFNFRGQKELGKNDFSKIPNGLPGTEHRPALIWTCGVCAGIVTAERTAALLSENPARAFNMYPRKGALLPGSDADVVIWDPGYEGVITAGKQTQNTDYTPWEGFRVKGRAKAVILGGEICAEDGSVIKKERGKYISR